MKEHRAMSVSSYTQTSGGARGPGSHAVAAAIAFSGLAVLASLVIWLAHLSGNEVSSPSPSSLAPHATQGIEGMAGMSGMSAGSGSTEAAPSEQVTLPANAAQLAAAHQPLPAALPPVGSGSVH